MLYVTHATVDLAAVRSNLANVRERVGGRGIMLPVKANAYGLGAVPISGMVQAEGLAEWLAVATTTEALELREAGITMPILRLSPAFPEEVPAALEHGVTLSVADEATVDAISALHKPVNVHLAVDTGMHRVGCAPEDAVRLARRISESSVRLQGVFTHLPIADVPAGDEFTRNQLELFRSVVRAIQADRAELGLDPVPLVHASNSAAALSHGLEDFTMVRPGIIVWGQRPDSHTPPPFEPQPVLGLHSKICALRRVPAGDTVGYGRTWQAGDDRWIATVPVGYADGFARRNSSVDTGGSMLVGGHRYPVAGRVCMDLTMLDVGPASEPSPVQIGDDVTIVGRQGGAEITADEVADRLGTISYELLTRLAPRVKRVYLNR